VLRQIFGKSCDKIGRIAVLSEKTKKKGVIFERIAKIMEECLPFFPSD